MKRSQLLRLWRFDFPAMHLTGGKMKSSALLAVSFGALCIFSACGSGSSQSGGNPPPPATPTITSISPNTAVAGGAAFTLTINGTNFVASSMVNFVGARTTFVNSTQLTAAIPASSIASAGMSAVTVTNPGPGGGTSNAINFTVTGTSSVPTLNYLFPSCVPAGEQFLNQFSNFENNQLTVGGLNFEVSSVVQWNGSDRPTTLDPNSQGQTLTAQISASDIASPGIATVTVFNPAPGGGTSNSLPFTTMTGTVDPQSIAVDPAGKFAYVANVGCSGADVGYVSMYTINSTTGALESIGPPASSLDAGAGSVTVAPSGKFAYVANLGDDETTDGSVTTYAIDATTGALTSTGSTGGNCPGLCVPLSVAVDPSGKFAYVPNGDGAEPSNIAVYTIDATTGALTSKGKTTTDGFAVSVAVDPSGKFAYVSTGGTPGPAANVSMYTINATTGALTSIGTIAAGTSPGSVVVDPAGKFVYVANPGSNDVSMYTMNATTGTLTSIGTIATGTDPVSISVDPASKFAYVVNFSSNDVSMYTINATTGALTSIGTIATGQFPTSIAVHPSGNFAYVTNSGSNDVSIYSIDSATGALTLVGTIGT